MTSIIQGLAITAGTLLVYQYSVYTALNEAQTRAMVFTVLIVANIFCQVKLAAAIRSNPYDEFSSFLKRRLLNFLFLKCDMRGIIRSNPTFLSSSFRSYVFHYYWCEEKFCAPSKRLFDLKRWVELQPEDERLITITGTDIQVQRAQFFIFTRIAEQTGQLFEEVWILKNEDINCCKTHFPWKPCLDWQDQNHCIIFARKKYRILESTSLVFPLTLA